MTWQYFNPVRVVYVTNATAQLIDHIEFQRVVLVTSPGFRRRGVVDRIQQSLGRRLIAVLDDVQPNPDLLDIDRQAGLVRGLDADCILALGGGSSMDTAKALARLLTQTESMTLAAHFRDGKAMSAAPALPLVTIPTTSGTGSEVTPFGTIWDFQTKKKYSITGNDLYSSMAILDPELVLGLPEEVTISSGLDAISHALESAWNRSANPITLALVAKSLQLSLPALELLKGDPENIEARGAMMQASLLAGLAISQTRTALAHSISYPLTTKYNLPHGIACSFTLPTLMRFNVAADDGRLRDLARAVGCANPGALADRLQGLFKHLEVGKIIERYIPNLAGITELRGKMFTPGRADNNLRIASEQDLSNILDDAIDSLTGG